MNRLFLYLIILLPGIFYQGCTDSRDPELRSVITAPTPAKVVKKPIGKIIGIDLDRSVIRWKGTKLRRTGKHEGEVKVKDGRLYMEAGRLKGGFAVADMHSISITDIPAHETVPIRNLTRHLNEDFATDQFPTARFEITNLRYETADSLTLNGNLTIKAVTRNIAVPARISGTGEGPHQVTTSFNFNRFDWGIGENGSWLEKKLVDEMITLSIEIFSH